MKKDKKLIGEKSLYAMFFTVCICFFLALHFVHCFSATNYAIRKTNQGLWIAGIRGDLVSNTIFEKGEWEPNVTKYLTEHVKPSETVIEIGANIGYYTTLLASIVGKNGKIYSYEANKHVFDLAILSLRMNALEREGVFLKNFAVSDSVGTIELVCASNEDFVLGGVNLGGTHLKFPLEKNDEKTVSVQSVTLDEDLPDVKNVDWLRMDIEGSEILALKGAKRIIESSPNLKIVMEWSVRMLGYYGDISTLIDEMHAYGFKFYHIDIQGKLGKELSKETLLNIPEIIDVVLMRKTSSIFSDTQNACPPALTAYSGCGD